jgi:Thioredoxin-like
MVRLTFFVLLIAALTVLPELRGNVPLPLSSKDIGLMLRSGYSSETVLRELSTRHFADLFDAEAEKQLKRAGANAVLLDALRNSAYPASASQLAALERKRNSHEPPSAATPTNEQGPGQIKGETNASSSERIPPANQVYRVLKGNLVIRQSGVLAPMDDESLRSKKLFLYFISANWSPVGRAFTPRLIEYYERVVKEHPEVEVVFFSADRSPFGMETYMNQSNMPWPAVAFPEITAQVGALQIDVTHDVPALILLDGSGKLLSRSEPNSASLDKVLGDLDKVLEQSAAR